MRIGDVALLAGVPAATVRYYERRGLIEKPPRTGSGYREYKEPVAVRLRFIKGAQELGFSLEEIQELLELKVDDPASCPVVEARTRAKIAAVRAKVSELHRLEGVLNQLVASCQQRERTAECPVLDALSSEPADA